MHVNQKYEVMSLKKILIRQVVYIIHTTGCQQPVHEKADDLKVKFRNFTCRIHIQCLL